jgi:hypothetical protein
MVNFLLDQQNGYTKYPCFLCLWDSRAKHEHWARKDLCLREYMVVGGQNVINKPLVARENHPATTTYKTRPDETICKGFE